MYVIKVQSYLPYRHTDFAGSSLWHFPGYVLTILCLKDNRFFSLSSRFDAQKELFILLQSCVTVGLSILKLFKKAYCNIVSHL